jgi:hypothetical protein
MKKNVAIPISVLRSGNRAEIKKYGLQPVSVEEISQHNADEMAHDEYVRALKYRDDRQSEYPPLAEFADAVYWQAMGDESKMQAWLDAVSAVKNKYPKPE